MMKISEAIKYYSKKDIQEQIVSSSKEREVSFRYFSGSFGKRPSVLLYPREIYQLAREGVISFHLSEEHWKNPMLLKQESTISELDEIRKGWDFIADIDGANFKYCSICAKLLVETFEFHEIKNISVKFSGNKGWHIGIPFDSFPKTVNGKETSQLFPEAPQVMADYLKNFISKYLSDEILEIEGSVKKIAKENNVKEETIVQNGVFNPWALLEIDTILISSRHLFRAPYSLNEKSGLVSLPIEKKGIMEFKKTDAKPENVSAVISFLESEKYQKNEAKELIQQAYDWTSRKNLEKEEKKKYEKYEEMNINKKDFDAKFFPPCILKILEGVPDGRKRAVFLLINFFKKIGYSWKDVEEELDAWNLKNKTPLPKRYISSQIEWAKQKKSEYIVPNCKNEAYYKGISVCSPDKSCAKINNPLSYVKIKLSDKKKQQNNKK